MYTCSYCPIEFASARKKIRHMVKFHKEHYKFDLTTEGWDRVKRMK